ncbi:thiamine pyrophosphokinase [Pyronema domesticum]|nr:thiamine pyrophosphokinase [Pyronema domesticum]
MGSDQSKITASANDATTATPATAAAKNGATAAVDGTTKKSDGTHWDPYSYFSPSINFPQDGPGPFALLILNQPIFNKSIFLNLWRKATLRVCADGGANRLFEALTPSERGLYLPTAIIGDLDSLRPSVRSFYSSHSVQINQDDDQNSTDFGKCMTFISLHDPSVCTESRRLSFRASIKPKKNADRTKKLAVVALGGFGGRMDQSFHSIHALYTSQQGEGIPRQVYLFSSESIAFLLRPGRNLLKTPRDHLGPSCGIIPVGGPAVVTTKGLEWNLEGQETRFGGLVSTSNHTVEDEVMVETTEQVLWTVEFRREREDREEVEEE